MSCPRCGEDLELDPDGGWCNECGQYWDLTVLKDFQEEEDDEDLREELQEDYQYFFELDAQDQSVLEGKS